MPLRTHSPRSMTRCGRLCSGSHWLRTGTPPNYPQATTGFNFLSSLPTTLLPSEVALCLSFQAPRIPGQIQNRRQGRVYIGPLNTGVASAGRPSSTARSTLAAAAGVLGVDIQTDTDGFWAVWSAMNGTTAEVEEGWVDDAFDTQRRRGLQRTTKTTFAF